MNDTLGPRGSGRAGLFTDILTTTAELDAVRADWETLHRVATPTNPFNQWSWARHWWRTYRREGLWLRDQLHIHVQRDECGTVRAILPFVVTSSGFGSATVGKLRLFGSVPGDVLTELPEMLMWPGYENVCCATLVDALQRNQASYDWCELDGLPLNGPHGRWFRTQVALSGWVERPTIPYYTLALPGTWDDLRATLKPHIKKNLRNSYAALARDGHTWTGTAVTDPSAVATALGEFFRLHAARAACTRGPRHPDHFARPLARRFLGDVADQLASEGRFMVCELRVAGSVVASRLVFLSGGGFYLYHSGFDPAWWRYSVSTVLTAECIKLAIAAGAHEVNLSAGRDASKLRWGPQECLIGGVLIASSSTRSRMLAFTEALRSRFARQQAPVVASTRE